jgi:hypothetical protein
MTANRMADIASPRTAGRPLKSPLAAHSHGTARGGVSDLRKNDIDVEFSHRVVAPWAGVPAGAGTPVRCERGC